MSDKFWSSPDLEPKRKQRFRVEMSFSDGGIVEWVAKDAQRPNFEVNSEAHNYLNHEFNFPGTVSWNDIDITLVDPISVGATHKTLRYIFNAGYTLPNDISAQNTRADFQTYSKRGSEQNLDNLFISQLSADGDEIEAWGIQNPFITSFDTGDLAYDDDGLVELSLTWTYDYAVFLDDDESGRSPDIFDGSYDTSEEI